MTQGRPCSAPLSVYRGRFAARGLIRTADTKTTLPMRHLHQSELRTDVGMAEVRDVASPLQPCHEARLRYSPPPASLACCWATLSRHRGHDHGCRRNCQAIACPDLGGSPPTLHRLPQQWCHEQRRHPLERPLGCHSLILHCACARLRTGECTCPPLLVTQSTCCAMGTTLRPMLCGRPQHDADAPQVAVSAP